jgi:hypothetical protein
MYEVPQLTMFDINHHHFVEKFKDLMGKSKPLVKDWRNTNKMLLRHVSESNLHAKVK